jgi:hypothetical protein
VQNIGIMELLVLVFLGVGLAIAAFCLALIVYLKARRLETTMALPKAQPRH